MLAWSIFGIIVVGVLVLDLGVLHRKAHAVSPKEAFLWSITWVGLSLLFAFYVFYARGQQASIDYVTGYLVEKSLSIDNIFVIYTIFQAFNIPLVLQHRVLMWGIIGAIVLRALFIGLGVALVQEFTWIFYVFGVFLIYTAYQMLKGETSTKDILHHPVILYIKRHIALTNELHGQKFFVRENGKRLGTPLLLCLVAIEFSDIIFAIDSIPAIFAITTDPFIVFTSNIFAILGLRSLYFVLAQAAVRFKYLPHGLAFILSYIGVKMLIQSIYHIPSFLSLSVIGFAISVSIGLSIFVEKKRPKI